MGQMGQNSVPALVAWKCESRSLWLWPQSPPHHSCVEQEGVPWLPGGPQDCAVTCSQCVKFPLGALGTQGKRSHRARITPSVPFIPFGPGGKDSPSQKDKKLWWKGYPFLQGYCSCSSCHSLNFQFWRRVIARFSLKTDLKTFRVKRIRDFTFLIFFSHSCYFRGTLKEFCLNVLNKSKSPQAGIWKSEFNSDEFLKICS